MEISSDPHGLAFDPARRSGAAWIVDGVFETTEFELGKPGKIGSHLVEMSDRAGGLMDALRPSFVAIESDTGRGAGSRTLVKYQGAVQAEAARRGIPVIEMCAVSARKVILGKGITDKIEAHALARILLSIPDNTGPDALDAIILLAAAALSMTAPKKTKTKPKKKPKSV